MRGTRGFVSVNDGVATMKQLSRALAIRDEVRAGYVVMFGEMAQPAEPLLLQLTPEQLRSRRALVGRRGASSPWRPWSTAPKSYGTAERHASPAWRFVPAWRRAALARQARWASGVVPASPTPGDEQGVLADVLTKIENDRRHGALPVRPLR